VPLREKNLISHIRRSARRSKAVLTGIGDDCAVLRFPPGHELLVTTDFSIENIHFRRAWHPPELVGWRCLTRGLSDIAAMGGEPLAAFLSLAVASDVPQTWVNRFFNGLLTLANKFKVPLAGGDTAQSPSGIQADIVVVGSVPKGRAVLRSGAKAGDQIYVTGALGGAAATLGLLMEGKRVGKAYSPYLRPLPRLAIGQWLRRRAIPSAMIDLSDGLSTDLAHICQESHAGAEIDAAAIPRQRPARDKKPVALDLALNGGDDYELLFTSASSVPSKIAGVQVTRIGLITRSKDMRLLAADGQPRPFKAAGWEHFAQSS
jgi:thiamine-monophosphate kinase